MANNITIIVDNLASLPSNPYTYFNTTANKYYTYYAFSASTIVSADISASETFGENVNLVSLPNIDSDVYAIRAEIEEYYYESGEASARTCTYSGSICAKENVACTNFEFDIEQKGCQSGPTPSFVTVNFNLNGHGTTPTPQSQTIETGGYADKPEDPADSSEDYDFLGWFETE